MVKLFIHEDKQAKKDDVKELINAASNDSGAKFLDKWCATTGMPREALPKYYWDMVGEVREMGRLDMEDVDLVEKVKQAGVQGDRAVQCRVVYTKNERVEAERRDKALAAFKAAGGCTLVSLEHDGTPMLMHGNINLAAEAAKVGVKLVVKPYRAKLDLLEALKNYDPSIQAADWDIAEEDWEEHQVVESEVLHFLRQKKKEDRHCPMAFAKLLKYMELPTPAGEFRIGEIFVSVPKNKDALYVWRWTGKWEQFPSSVQASYLADRCRELVGRLLGPGNHPQLEMLSMFNTAVQHAVTTSLFRPAFVNLLNTNMDLIMFDCNRSLHRNTKELLPPRPEAMQSLSTGYPFPEEQIAELKVRLSEAGLDLHTVFTRLKNRETQILIEWEVLPADLVEQLQGIYKCIQAVADIHELYEPNWLLTIHVLKFMASLLFSRGNEENAFPMGGGNNGKSFLMFVLEMLLGQYSCGVQAGLYGKPVPSCAGTNSDWLALVGRKASPAQSNLKVTSK